MLLGLIGILMAFGHSFLAMSGEESLAQVNRELEYPKHQNLMKAGMVIFVYSLLFTSLVSFFAYALIPDDVRPQYFNNLISGIAMYLAGPMPLKLLFQGFIVIVGFLMLAGAINTSIIGSNGVLNRVSEDGVMTDWFRAPHRKYGTTYRMINLIVILQLVAIVGSRGNTYTLGEAYAFGVIWSFAFKGLAMLVLRFKDTSHREWKVPFNLHLGGYEIPIGLGVIALILFSIAGINLITKQVATVSGVAFTLVFFVVFVVSERINERKRGAEAHVEMDQFRLQPQEVISSETVEVRPGNSLCVVRDYNTLDHVKKALEMTHTGKRDLVVMTVHVMKGPDAGYEDISHDQLFTRYEQLLFSRVTVGRGEGRQARRPARRAGHERVRRDRADGRAPRLGRHLGGPLVGDGAGRAGQAHRRRVGAAAEEAESAGHDSRGRSRRHVERLHAGRARADAGRRRHRPDPHLWLDATKRRRRRGSAPSGDRDRGAGAAGGGVEGPGRAGDARAAAPPARQAERATRRAAMPSAEAPVVAARPAVRHGRWRRTKKASSGSGPSPASRCSASTR